MADESVVQMINRPALIQLGAFTKNPTKANASQLVGIPAVLRVLVYHQGVYPPELLDMLTWLHGRGSEVLKQLIIHTPGAPKTLEPSNWREVSEPLARIHSLVY